MMNPEKNTAIPRTDRFMERLGTRMKFLLGDDVRIGQDYSGWETAGGEKYDGACRPILYENGRLYVLEGDRGGVAVLRGDLADYRGRLMADGRLAQYDISGLRDRVSAYMERNGIAGYTPEVGRHALWMKMLPRSMVLERAKVYELTKDLDWQAGPH